MSEIIPGRANFGTEPFPKLVVKASERIQGLLNESQAPTELWREWLTDYYQTSIMPDSIRVWQSLTETIFRQMPTDEIAGATSSVWITGHYPGTQYEAWSEGLAHIQLSTADVNDGNHILGRISLDRLEAMYANGFIVDERQYRTDVYTALLEAKPDISIRQYDVSAEPIRPELKEPTIHVRGEDFYARSIPGNFQLSYPSENEIANRMIMDGGQPRPLTLNEVFGHCCALESYNEIFGELAQSIAIVGRSIPEPRKYLVEDKTEDNKMQLYEV